MVGGKRPGRDPARQARWPRTGHADGARRAAWARAERDRSGARRARKRRRDSQGSFPCRRQRRAMVRPAPLGAHSSLHGSAAAVGDRAGRGAGFSALPVRLAACGRGDAPRGAGRAARGLERARRLRGARKSVGDRDPASAAQGLSGFVARLPMPRRANLMGAFDPARRRQRQWADAPCVASRLDPDRAHRAPPGAASGWRSRR